MSYQFSDEYVERLYMRAAPKGENHKGAFAWRESPATLDNHWKRKVCKYENHQKEDFLRMIFLAADAQEKDRKQRQANGERLYRPKGIAPWFAGGCWADGLENSTERETKERLCQCGNPSHFGERVQYKCIDCYDEWAKENNIVPHWDKLREKYKAMGVKSMTPEQQRQILKNFVQGFRR